MVVGEGGTILAVQNCFLTAGSLLQFHSHLTNLPVFMLQMSQYLIHQTDSSNLMTAAALPDGQYDLDLGPPQAAATLRL